jgi:RNA polymerase sigma-70 factor (ECF subfamily)
MAATAAAVPCGGRSWDESDVKRMVGAAQAGDRDAMRAIYVRFAGGVHVYVARIVPQRDAEDVTQQVFAKLLTELDRYRPGEAPFAAWVLRVARNLAIDHLRRSRLVPCEEVRGADDVADEAARECADSLREALAGLTADQRNVLILRHLVGLSPTEIAEQLGRTVRAVHCLHHRGRSAARTALHDLGAGPATVRPLAAARVERPATA